MNSNMGKRAKLRNLVMCCHVIFSRVGAGIYRVLATPIQHETPLGRVCVLLDLLLQAIAVSQLQLYAYSGYVYLGDTIAGSLRGTVC